MKLKYSVVATAIALLAFSGSINAQETIAGNNATKLLDQVSLEIDGKLTVDMVSSYMWRGIDKGGVSILPKGKVSWHDLSVQLQGASGFDKDDAKEINLGVGYQLGSVNFGITDYWTSGMDKEGRSLYFDWDNANGGHRIEANAGITLPFLSVQAYTIFWGNDFKYNTRLDSENRTSGKRAFSTYIELRVPFYMGGFDWDFAAGVTPFESAYNIVPVNTDSDLPYVEKDYYYGGSASCVMASVRATKRLELGDVKMPIFAELHTNPYMKRAGFLFGLTIEPF